MTLRVVMREGILLTLIGIVVGTVASTPLTGVLLSKLPRKLLI